MQPYKHYEADSIQSEIDKTQENPHADESTLRRWSAEFHKMKDHIEGTLRALMIETNGDSYPLFSQVSLLELLRKNQPRWLRLVNKAMINREFPYTPSLPLSIVL